MNMIVKEKLRKQREDIKVLSLKKESLTDKVKMQENFIREMESRGKDTIKKIDQKISELNIDIDCLNSDNEDHEKNVKRYTKERESVTDAKDKVRKLGNLKGKISQKISTISNTRKFFLDNDTCPTCTQEINSDMKSEKIDNLNKEVDKLESGYDELLETIKSEEFRESVFDNITRSIMESQSKISSNNAKISQLNAQVYGLNEDIKMINEQSENENEEKEKLQEYENKLEDTIDEIVKLKKSFSHYEYLHNLFKDSGVKSQTIEKYLPLINQQASKFLQMMDFYINFKLDGEFNETIESPIHEDFTYSSFSEGEKQRIDLALLFTWREVAKLKNSTNTNLLIMDEIFDSSLDGFGTDDFLKIIKFVIKDANIFVISHKESLHDKFDKVVKFEKRKNFSYIVEV